MCLHHGACVSRLLGLGERVPLLVLQGSPGWPCPTLEVSRACESSLFDAVRSVIFASRLRITAFCDSSCARCLSMSLSLAFMDLSAAANFFSLICMSCRLLCQSAWSTLQFAQL